MTNVEYTLLCPFGGLGAGALGFLRAETRLFETRARFRLLGGVDVDEEACADFEYLTGMLSQAMPAADPPIGFQTEAA